MKKRILFVFMVFALLALVSGCANTGAYNTQKGAAVGAAAGALGGQLIGKDTQSTLIGTGVGALLGTIVGNMEDQRSQQQQQAIRDAQYQHQAAQQVGGVQAYQPGATTYAGSDQAPPGQWVTVPGQWVSGKWVPSHTVWQPVNPQ